MQQKQENLVGVLSILYRWRKPVLWFCAAAIAGTTLIAFLFLDNYYKSTTVFYVASPDIFKPEQLFGTSVKDMEYYGSDDDVDRILTIAESGELKMFLVQKFGLYKHYDIDSTTEKGPFKVVDRLDKLYDVVKSKRNAVELSIEDTDKKLAAQMANAARDKIDEIAQRLIHESQTNNLKVLESDNATKEFELRRLSDTLVKMRTQYGVYDLEKQAETMSSVSAQAQANLIRNKAKLTALQGQTGVSQDTLALLRASIQGYDAEMKNGDANLKRYGEGMNDVSLYTQLYKKDREQLAANKERYIQLKTAYSAKVSAVHLIEPATTPYDKSRPHRSIIILTAAFLALLFSVFATLLAESYKEVNWAEEIRSA